MAHVVTTYVVMTYVLITYVVMADVVMALVPVRKMFSGVNGLPAARALVDSSSKSWTPSTTATDLYTT